MRLTLLKEIIHITRQRPNQLRMIGTTQHVQLLWELVVKYRQRSRTMACYIDALEKQRREDAQAIVHLVERLARMEEK